jgi:hypothetical protein
MNRTLLALLVSGCATSAAVSEHQLVRVHLDVAKPEAEPQLEATRAEYRAWAAQHGSPLGEAPVFFVRVGPHQLWALRPARGVNDLAAQNERDGQAEARVRAAVGTRFEANEALMHGAIIEHHNEWLRLQPELSRGDAPLSALLPGLTRVVIDRVIPIETDAYEAALKKTPPGGWRLVFVSSPGSGAFVHFFEHAEALPDDSLVRERQVFEATALPALSP